MPDATDNRVLSQLMLLQGTLDSMPTDESISRFVSRGLKSVPGVSFLNVCVRGTVAEKNDLCASCNYRWGETEDKFDYLCKPKDDSNTKHLPIRTADRLYGFVIFSLNDTPDAFTPYEPYLQNIVNVIAISIDNRRQKQVLEAFNKQLQGEVEHRKQVEETLRHENIFIEALFESIPGMLYVYDDQGTHIRHNKKHEEMTGYSEEELSHLNPLSWYDDKADIVRVEAAINDVFARGYGEVDAPMQIKNGEKLFMHFTGSRMIMDGKKYFIGVGIDITERKRAEELISRQKEEQQVIFDAVPAMIFFKDTENRFIRVNRAIAQASGMTVEQMEGKNCFELFPDLADKYWKDDKEVIAAGAPKRDIIESMATPNGVAWVKTDKIPYWDEKGNITGIIGFAIDITALMNTENALRKHFLFLETLIDTIPNPIFYKNIKGEYTGCNNAFAIYMGIRKEEILGKTVYDLSPKELADVYKKTDQELFDHPGVQVYETQIKYADEALRDVVFNKATFTDEDGNVNGLVGVILDITDRKRAEKIVVEEKKRWERTFEAVPDMIAILDNNFNIVQVNKAMSDRLGLEPDECAGQVCYAVVHGTDGPPAYCPHFQSIKDHREHTAEVSEERLGGIFNVSTSPLFDKQGQMIGSVHVTRDITKQKLLEGQLQTMSLSLIHI